VADTVAQSLEGGSTLAPGTLKSQQQAICMPLENNLFKAAFAAGLFPTAPPMPTRAARSKLEGRRAAPAISGEHRERRSGRSRVPQVERQRPHARADPARLLPGEVFPFTETRGAIDEALMPFPTDCYEPITENFHCGAPLPMTPWSPRG